MVSSETNKRKTIGKIIFCICLFAIAACFVIGVMYILKKETPASEQDENEEEVVVIEPEIVEPEAPVIPEINFQDVVDDWANYVGGSKGIAIYDLDLNKTVGQYNADEKFATASIYKLFVVYEGYRLVQNGEWGADDPAGFTGYTISECLDLSIRESYSPCAETLWALIGHDELDNIVHSDFAMSDMWVSELAATPNEVMEMMKLYYNHPELTDESLIAQMKDSFLNQPVTTYDWRQGLPSGFSEQVNVYNKVGWNWNGSYWTIYDDAAIIDFTEKDRHFIVVVMTSGVNFQQIRNFGSRIEEKFFSTY